MLTQSLNQGNNNMIKYDTVCRRYTINNLKIYTVSNKKNIMGKIPFKTSLHILLQLLNQSNIL